MRQWKERTRRRVTVDLPASARIKIQNTSSLGLKFAVARKDPAAMLPRTNRVFIFNPSVRFFTEAFVQRIRFCGKRLESLSQESLKNRASTPIAHQNRPNQPRAIKRRLRIKAAILEFGLFRSYVKKPPIGQRCWPNTMRQEPWTFCGATLKEKAVLCTREIRHFDAMQLTRLDGEHSCSQSTFVNLVNKPFILENTTLQSITA
ncbi:MAG: hypothetical protein ACRER2_19085 [Methylococcales bacterium]